MKLTCGEFAGRLRAACEAENAAFVIVYHINPDGDCIGSAFGLALILRALGAKCRVIGRDPVPAQFRCMTDCIPADDMPESVQYIGVDCKDCARTGTDFLALPYRFWIDHHGSPLENAACEFVRPECSACSELVLQLAEALGVTVTKQIADLLYTAVITDTNCFRTPSTNRETFLAAARLVQCGADSYGIARRYALVKSEARLAVEQRIFRKARFLCGGKLVSSTLTLEDLAAAGIPSQKDSALENINGVLEVMENVLVTVLVREYPQDNPEGRSRFSIKTAMPALSARAVAEALGGGGHLQAAGGFIRTDPDAARAEAERLCAEMLGRAEKNEK